MDSQQFAYDIFISHASEDKEAVARPLAHALERLGLRVWFDEALLNVGDSLSSKIDEGLANARFGVVVLSKIFFEKGWPKYELSGLKARQVHGEQVIMPIWHGVTVQDILTRSPPLADLLSASTADSTIDQVAEKIFYAASRDHYSAWLTKAGEDCFTALEDAHFTDSKGKQRSAVGGLLTLYDHLLPVVNYQQLTRRFGRRIFLAGPHSDTHLDVHNDASFGHYNPDFIDWISRHVLLFVSKTFLVRASQSIYDRTLAEPARLFYCAHQLLHANPEILASLRDEYRDLIESGSLPSQFYGNAAWVRTCNTPEETLAYTLNDWFDGNSAASALYFWLRRDIDGTRGACFSVLRDIMKAYDNPTLFNINTHLTWIITSGMPTQKNFL
jgi:hypothetical protein